jgi:hypothetical protein
VATGLIASTAQADVVGSAAAFTVRGTNGFKIVALADSRRADGRGEVVMFVGRRREGVSYLAPATVTDQAIEADLGALGQIALRFVPSGEVAEERSACGGDPIQFEAGRYEGAFEFRGEEGFATAEVESVRAEAKPFLGLACSGRIEGESRGPGLPGARLLIRDPDRKLTLRAFENRPGARVFYSAEMHERRGRIAISRSVEGRARTEAFRFSHDLKSALFRPSVPFSGSAAFSRAARPSQRWRGSLSIDFPGSSNVPLVGPSVTTTLVHARRTFN